jgi:urease subunit beta
VTGASAPAGSPSPAAVPDGGASIGIIPGEILLSQSPVDLGDEAPALTMVMNTGDRPVQVGSHFHFAESNIALLFDRELAWGRRLAIPAGTAVRFEPGIEREVGLVPLAGRRRVFGLRGLAGGPLDTGHEP